MERVVLGPGEMAVAAGDEVTMEAPSLGSTLALCALDGERGVAGVAVFVVPKVPEGKGGSDERPAMGVAQGLPRFVKALQEAGARPGSLRFWLVGASQFMSASPDFALGPQLYSLVKKTLANNGLTMVEEAVGGVRNRGVSLSPQADSPTIVVGPKEEGR